MWPTAWSLIEYDIQSGIRFTKMRGGGSSNEHTVLEVGFQVQLFSCRVEASPQESLRVSF